MNSNSNKDGQKRCKCKKSKCSKLYCECFAAGLFCGETCSCKECLNTRDYEDTVEDVRKQIQLRNPNAFLSKIRCLVESPTSHNVENGDRLGPVAGKHRRGCNCKKSMCQKKYCECYQANVGCSDDCRCQGCQNVFGKKADYNVFNKSIHGFGFSIHDVNNPHNFTPVTPFQHSGYEYDPPTTGGYIPSPGSANSDMMLGTSTGDFDMVSLDQQAYLNALTNQCTPPGSTYFNGRHLNSVMSIPPMMDLPNSSTASVSYSSVITWPDSLITPEPVFSWPNVMNSNDWSP